MLRTRALLLAAVAVVAAACGGAAAPQPAATATPAPPTTPPAATSAGASTGGARWTVTDASKATVSVREQLVGFNLPSDAVLTAKGAKGAGLNPDGTFTSDSKITFELSTLSSDQGQRDNFVKSNTLNVRQFPTAEFVPVKITGVTLPLASGDFTGTLSGTMSIRGVTKDVTFAVKGTRSGGQLTATATADPVFTFGQFGMQPPTVAGRVLSIVDAIHLTVDLVATSS